MHAGAESESNAILRRTHAGKAKLLVGEEQKSE